MTYPTAKMTSSTSNGSIHIQKCKRSRIHDVDLNNPGFGDIFSDHMLSMHYQDGEWQHPEIIPFGDLPLSPATAALHYGQTVFEGMKAFRGKDDNVRIFRLRDHLRRLNESCARMCIPPLDTRSVEQALKRLISIDRQWVPKKSGNALYIRPLILATDACLGVKPAQSYQLVIMTSPVGAYYEEGFNPVSLTTSDQYIRAAKGGSGTAKTACNYGPTLLPAQKAKEQGFTQIIWLDAREHKYIEEVGTMNIFFKINGELHTPQLNGSILGGITRESVITLTQGWNIPVHERPITIDEIFEVHRNNKLEEVFGTGTAAVISPVGSITHNEECLVTDKKQIGPFAKRLFDTITGIQHSTYEDSQQWMSSIG